MQHVMTPERTADLQTTKRTSALLACGVVAGPLFTVVGLIQAFTRPGFDLTRNALSVLENGDLGWVQISSFFVTGLLFVASAIGMRQILGRHQGGVWGPRWITIMGFGLFGAAFFRADPGLGFPPGTPMNAMTLSWHGVGHLLVSTVAFLSLIAACIVFARRFAIHHQRGWAIYSAVTGAASFITLAGLSSGHLWMNSAFVFAMLNGLVWVSVMAAKLLIERSPAAA